LVPQMEGTWGRILRAPLSPFPTPPKKTVNPHTSHKPVNRLQESNWLPTAGRGGGAKWSLSTRGPCHPPWKLLVPG
jgi:hypothetical protein